MFHSMKNITVLDFISPEKKNNNCTAKKNKTTIEKLVQSVLSTSTVQNNTEYRGY